MVRPGPAVFAAAVLTGAATGALGAEDASTQRRFALLVSHTDGGPGTETLRYAERDANKLADVLVQMGGFARADVTQVRSPDPEALRAALRGVEAALGEASLTGTPTMLVFYYSGHAGEGALRLGDDRLPLAELQATLRASRAGVRLAFLDACASGEVTRLKGARREASFIVEQAPDATGYVVITSSRHDEASQESDELRGSFFTHALVSGLRGAGDRNGDGAVTLNEAYDHAYHRTVARTAQTRGGTQHPTYSYDLRGDGAVVLTRLSGLGTLLFGPAGPGSFLVYDPRQDVVVAEVDQVPGTSAKLSLRPGVYLVKKRAPDAVLLESVIVPDGGGAVAVDPDRFAVVAYEDDVTKGVDAREHLRADRRFVWLGAGFGMQTFFAQPSGDVLFPTTPLVTARVAFPGLLGPRLGLHAVAAFGRVDHRFTVAGYDHRAAYSLMITGLGLDFDLPAGPLWFQLGPRLSAVWAGRRFDEADAPPAQSLFTFSPGAGAALRWPIPAVDLRAGLAARVHYLRYTTTTEDASLGFGEAFLSLEYAP